MRLPSSVPVMLLHSCFIIVVMVTGGYGLFMDKRQGSRPEPPVNVRVEACWVFSAFINWTESTHTITPATKYNVEYNTSSAPNVWTNASIEILDHSLTRAAVKLFPYANFSFRVIAENEFGKSEPSNPTESSCLTPMFFPYKNPSNVHTDTSETGWLIIKWDIMPVIAHSGEGFSYVVTIGKDGMNNTVTIEDWRKNKYEYPTEDVYQPYEISVKAQNAYGLSWRQAKVYTGFSGEGEPKVVPQNFELTFVNGYVAVFQWDQVDTSPEMMAGKFLGFKIRFWKAGQREETEKFTLMPLSMFEVTGNKTMKEQWHLRNLPFDTDIETEVVASNTHFNSSPSNIVTFRTPGGARPKTPWYVKLESCSSRSAVISWINSPYSRTPATEYYIEYNTSFTPDVWTNAAVVTDPSQNETEVTLSPYANYTFRVIAANEFGKSEPTWCTAKVCCTPKDIPYKNPSNVHTDTSETGWLIVKWDVMPEIEHNGEGFRYIITTRSEDELFKFAETIEDWRENTYKRRTMDVYHPYEITVRSQNEVGDSLEPPVAHIGYSGEAEPTVVPGNFELVSVNQNSASFQWDPVDTSPEMMLGKFKGYKIRFWKAGKREATEEVVFVSGVLSTQSIMVKETATIDNLPFYSDLEAEVMASNTHFDSPPSDFVTFTTPARGGGGDGNLQRSSLKNKSSRSNYGNISSLIEELLRDF